ncbi:AB-hydrolase YheT [Tothia fuscella]|uniref:alcohol O-acetyltransferase n=1 Tax=Tothia fuscella TaxID=1048955 RepID=A0A9P4NVZ2_9PEZI|nr:AB-hydrolase YheT [Tothia fuscella]
MPETTSSSTSADNAIDSSSTPTETTLLTLIKSTTPPCWLNPLLFNGHLQTFYTALKSTDIPITYKRRTFSSNNALYPGTFAVDFVSHTPTSSSSSDPDPSLPSRTSYYSDEEFEKLGGEDDEKPMLILLHGLSGGSHEIYLRHVLRPLCLDPKEGEEKWEACVVNARGCSMSEITSGVLYNARSTWDVRQIVEWIREKWPKRKLFGVGFSLGANILVNYIGEEGAKCELDAAVVVSNPWNLDVSNLSLQRSFMGKNIYSPAMGTSMRELFETQTEEDNRHHEQIMKYNPDIDEAKVRSIKYLHEFDRYVQCPTWGWPTEGAYYRDASSIDAIYDIRIPVLAIHAEDDPIACDAAAPYVEVQQNENVVLCSTTLGGHLSWFEIGGERWFSRVAEGFLRKMTTEVDLDALKNSRTSGTQEGSVLHAKKKPVYHGVAKKLQNPEPHS